jgi:hypothetical protein
MKTSLRVVALFASFSLVPVVAVATDYAPQPVQPTEPAPTWLPPPPTQIDVTTGEEVVVQQAPPAGQWVFTSQYGWVWMPHGNSFTFLPANGAAPNMFVFYPAVGWSWVVAPWVWGWGAMPWFGFAGWGGYPWWGSGFGRWYGFARPYAYAGWNGGRYWHGGQWHGVGGARPPPPRPGGAVPPGPRAGAAPSPRGGPGAPPRVGSISPGRPTYGASGKTAVAPGRSYGSPAGYSPGRSYPTPTRAFTSGGQNFAPRSYASAAPRGPSSGGYSGGGFSGAGRGGGGFGGGAGRGGSGGGGGGGHGGGGGRR